MEEFLKNESFHSQHFRKTFIFQFNQEYKQEAYLSSLNFNTNLSFCIITLLFSLIYLIALELTV